MKKRRKGRMLALLLALVMAFTMVPPVNAKATALRSQIRLDGIVTTDEHCTSTVELVKEGEAETGTATITYKNGNDIVGVVTVSGISELGTYQDGDQEDPTISKTLVTSSAALDFTVSPALGYEVSTASCDTNHPEGQSAPALTQDGENAAVYHFTNYTLNWDGSSNQIDNSVRFEFRAKENVYLVNFNQTSWVIGEATASVTSFGASSTVPEANGTYEIGKNDVINLSGFDPDTMKVVFAKSDGFSVNKSDLANSAQTSINEVMPTQANDAVYTFSIESKNSGGGNQGSNNNPVNYLVNFGENSWEINDGQAVKTISAFIGDGETNTIIANTPMEVTSNTTIKLYGGFDPSTMHVQVTDSADTSGNPFTATLATNVGPDSAPYYETNY